MQLAAQGAHLFGIDAVAGKKDDATHCWLAQHRAFRGSRLQPGNIDHQRPPSRALQLSL
jgi:hypothetical protein